MESAYSRLTYFSIAERSTKKTHCGFAGTKSGVQDFEYKRDLNRRVDHARGRIVESLRVKSVTLDEWADAI